jgi:hypothetical protein
MWILILPAAGAFSTAGETLLPEEKIELSQSKSLNSRIKIYHAASQRMVQALQDAVRKEQFETVPDALEAWVSLLEASIKDIEADPKANKKSKKLRKFEIHIRKTLKDLPNMKLKAPYEQIDAFDSCVAKAETIRKKIVDILFKH